MILSPIVVFVYNRESHTRQTIEALCRNQLAVQSELFVFSDGPKTKKDIDKVEAVRKYISNIKKGNMFKKVTVLESSVNKGLANSIISGVTEIINIYNKVIVVEDDILVAPDFLDYMNNALDFFELNEKVWCIGGYSFLHNYPSDYKLDIFFMGRNSSYVWGTWKNRWDKTDWSIKDYNKFKYNYFLRKKFNLYGNDRSLMLDNQMSGKVNSWAVRFEYSMFKNDMYAVLPRYSRSKSIGFDGSGVHCGVNSDFQEKQQIIEMDCPLKFVNTVNIDERIRNEYRKFFDIKTYKRFIYFFANILNIDIKKLKQRKQKIAKLLKSFLKSL